MTDTVTGLVVAVEAGEGEQVVSLALAERCVRIEGREGSQEELEDFFTESQSRSVEASDGAVRLTAGSSVCLVERILAGELHNGVIVVEPGLCQVSPALAARTGLAGGLERLLIIHHNRGVVTISTQPGVGESLQLAVDGVGEEVLLYKQVVLPLAVKAPPDLVVAAFSPHSPPQLVRMLAGLGGGRLVVVLQSGHHHTSSLALSC